VLADVFTFIGTLLIGFEIVRKITYANTFLLALVGPIAVFINSIKIKKGKTKFPRSEKVKFTPLNLIGIVLFIPLALLFGTIAQIIIVISGILRWVNAKLNLLASGEARKFRPFYKELAGIVIEKQKRV
jgi:hypothetical protein